MSILDPKEIYSAADFVRDADIQIADALAKGKTPIIVGGTMLYVKCFLDGIAKLPDADDAIRQTLVDELHSRGGQALHDELARIDLSLKHISEPTRPERI